MSLWDSKNPRPGPPAAYISFDPGSARTGVVEWSNAGNMIIWYEFDPDTLVDYLDAQEPGMVAWIYEEYRIVSGIPHHNSRVETVQVIGSIKYRARQLKIPCIEQLRSVKNDAQKWSQLKVEKGHMKDWKAAYLHGYYYLVRKGIIQLKVPKELQ